MAEADLRKLVLASFRKALEAVDPRRLVRDVLVAADLSMPGRLVPVAVGKAAAGMARGASDALLGQLESGVAIVPPGTVTDLAGFELHSGGHPIPDEAGVSGARRILELVSDLGEDDLLLFLLSGGGSALMTLPCEGLSLADLRSTTRQLLRSGATIDELNCVRKHLDQLKGGRLAARAAPARLLALVISDVVGDPLDVIASGPVVPDPTTFADARAVLERRGVLPTVPAAVRRHLERGLRGEAEESPKADHPSFSRVDARIIGDNRRAAETALAEAERRGYRTLLLSTVLTGEAREVGRVLASLGQEIRRSGRPLEPPACLLAAGETTVTVEGRGRGGRNQEVALGAALALDGAAQSDGVLVASLGTDGIDGPTDAAGAFASSSTARRARARGLDPERALAQNDAYPLFDVLEDLVRTGPTGTNVMDLMWVLVE